jgi:hypothetical protein
MNEEDRQFVPSEVTTKATAALDKEVAEELNIPDPTPEEAKAVFKKDDEE